MSNLRTARPSTPLHHGETRTVVELLTFPGPDYVHGSDIPIVGGTESKESWPRNGQRPTQRSDTGGKPEVAGNMADIHDRAQEVFREVFEDPMLAISEQTEAADIPEWDSLAHINLILALEEEFGIEFSSAEVTSMANVGDLFTVLETKR